MIHVIAQHIGKGTYTAWYDILNFKEEYILYKFDDQDDIEKKLIGDPPYFDRIIEKLDSINPKKDDLVILDLSYIFNFNVHEFNKNMLKLSKKYNECKFFLFQDDNALPYLDNEIYTVFSNRFSINENNINCNYYRYRAPLQDYWSSLVYVTDKFIRNYRQKKINIIVGVDKKERLHIFKYFYKTGLNLDSWMGYSAFTCNYDDSEISEGLLEFRNKNIPIILDSTRELSLNGDINVEIPPLPITMTSYVSCILETAILLGDEIHLSEKSWNPFISKNIPLILGSTYINKYLKDLGFWLADDLFDLTPQFSRDSILQQYQNNLDIINKMKIEDLHTYYIKNKNNIDSNFNLLQNQKFIFDRNNYK
jgi:hypothetical protein